MKTRKLLCTALCAAVVGGGFSGALAEEETVSRTQESTTDYAEDSEEASELIAQADNRLGSRLTAKLLEKEENVFLSPYSIASVLSMLTNASEKGEQIRELKDFLGESTEGYAELTARELRAAEKQCMKKLIPETDGGLSGNQAETVELANAFYVDEKLIPAADYEAFVNEISDAYRAKAAKKVLSSEQTMEEINEWADEKTHGLIKKLLDEPLSPDALTVLMNAVYFKGAWMKPFPKEATDEQSFYGTKGENKVAMMHQQDRFSYAENDKYQVICLPYYCNYEMYLYLPKNADGWKDWTDPEKLESLKDNSAWEFESKEVMLSLPKLELEYGAFLTEPLEELGLNGIFEEAVYERICEEPLYVDQILHKSVIRLDEMGTEAAAVTIMVMETLALYEDEPIEMTVDRPFFFTITNRETGINLFEGAVLNFE